MDRIRPFQLLLGSIGCILLAVLIGRWLPAYGVNAPRWMFPVLILPSPILTVAAFGWSIWQTVKTRKLRPGNVVTIVLGAFLLYVFVMATLVAWWARVL